MKSLIHQVIPGEHLFTRKTKWRDDRVYVVQKSATLNSWNDISLTWKGLPKHLVVRGDLSFEAFDFKSSVPFAMPSYLKVEGALDIEDCIISNMPEYLVCEQFWFIDSNVDEYFLTQGVFGQQERVAAPIFHAERGWLISLGCFLGTKEEAVSAIGSSYIERATGELTQDGKEYIRMVEEFMDKFSN